MEKPELDSLVLEVVARFEQRRDIMTYVRNIYNFLMEEHKIADLKQHQVSYSLARLIKVGDVQKVGSGAGTRYYLSRRQRILRKLPEDPYKGVKSYDDHLDSWPLYSSSTVRGIFLEAYFRTKFKLRPTSMDPDIELWRYEAGSLVGTLPPANLSLRMVDSLVRLGIVESYGGGYYRLTDQGKQQFGHKLAWWWRPDPNWNIRNLL